MFISIYENEILTGSVDLIFHILSVNCSHVCFIYVKIYMKISSGGLEVSLSIHRGSYMSAHVLLNLFNELGKRDKMRGLPSILSLFRNEFNKFNNTRARMLDSIYHMTNTLKSHFWRKTLLFCHYVRNVVMDVITFPVNL